MHGTFSGIKVPSIQTGNGGWQPYIPGLFRWSEVVRQLGYEPTLYVMRKCDGGKWFYRACTADELSEIEKQASS
jgi:hypothetical protein